MRRLPEGARALSGILSALHHFDDDARDVVARAGVERQLPQGIGALLHVAVFLQTLQQLVVGNDATQSVAAKQEAVAQLEGHDLDVWPVADFLGAQVLPEHIAEAVLARLVAGLPGMRLLRLRSVVITLSES